MQINNSHFNDIETLPQAETGAAEEHSAAAPQQERTARSATFENLEAKTPLRQPQIQLIVTKHTNGTKPDSMADRTEAKLIADFPRAATVRNMHCSSTVEAQSPTTSAYGESPSPPAPCGVLDSIASTGRSIKSIGALAGNQAPSLADYRSAIRAAHAARLQAGQARTAMSEEPGLDTTRRNRFAGLHYFLERVFWIVLLLAIPWLLWMLAEKLPLFASTYEMGQARCQECTKPDGS